MTNSVRLLKDKPSDISGDFTDETFLCIKLYGSVLCVEILKATQHTRVSVNTNIEHDISKTAVLEFSHTAISRNSQKFTLKEFGGELVLSQNL